jgi:hypothetical protein
MSPEKLERVSIPRPTELRTSRRFCCAFLSASAREAIRLNRHLSAAGIRAYHASAAREAQMLLAITSARILLIDIDRTFEPWTEILQTLDESHPDVPKVVLTARDEALWSPILSYFAVNVVPSIVGAYIYSFARPGWLRVALGITRSGHSR